MSSHHGLVFLYALSHISDSLRTYSTADLATWYVCTVLLYFLIHNLYGTWTLVVPVGPSIFRLEMTSTSKLAGIQPAPHIVNCTNSNCTRWIIIQHGGVAVGCLHNTYVRIHLQAANTSFKSAQGGTGANPKGVPPPPGAKSFKRTASKAPHPGQASQDGGPSVMSKMKRSMTLLAGRPVSEAGMTERSTRVSPLSP